MSDSSNAPRTLPERPDLRHLRDQARELLQSGHAATLADAQFQIARSYGFPSWPKLKSHVDSLREVGQLKTAIDSNDLERVQAMMSRNPALHHAPLGYGQNGPLTWAAECRVPSGPPTPDRLAIVEWMLKNGSDVHQGGDGPLMRAALRDDRIPMMELLVQYGADVNARWGGNYPILLAPCETLAPRVLKWLLDHGADPNVESPSYGNPLSMLIGTYARNHSGKHACLEVLAEVGFGLPDTPVMALHRGRIDLLETHLERDPGYLRKRLTLNEIYPPECGSDESGGLHVTPVENTTLLHLAIEYDEIEIAQWLLDRGAEVNARAGLDDEGFGGHTPLFHTVVTLGRRDEDKARLLLHHGADPCVRATIRKQLRDTGNPEKDRMREFHNVTALSYARQFQEPAWISEPALALIAAAGGVM